MLSVRVPLARRRTDTYACKFVKFLLDVSASSRSMRATLTRLGHDVLSASDMTPGAADEEILALAAEEGRFLVTEDKDFGELVFVRGWLTVHHSIH